MWVNYFIHTSVAVLSGSNFLQAWFNRELHIDLCEFQWKEVKIAHLLSLVSLVHSLSLCLYVYMYIYLDTWGFFTIVRGGKIPQMQQKSEGDNCRKGLKMHKPFIPLVPPVVYLINLPI